MVLSDNALAIFYRLSIVTNSNHVSTCSGLAAIFNGMFQAMRSRISETVTYRVKVIINHY